MSPRLIVNIDVPDLTAAQRFYRQGLGLTLSRLLFDGTVVELTAGSLQVYLIEQSADSIAVAGTALRRSYQPHWTPVHLDVIVDDIDAAVSRALSAGATRQGEIQHHRWGKLAPLRDPFGHGICLIEFVGAGYEGEAVADRP